VSNRALGTCAGVLAAVGFYVLPAGSQRDPTADRVPSTPSLAAAARLRDDALARARTLVGDINRDALTAEPPDPKGLLTQDEVRCSFVPHAPGGTSLKFDCALDDGEVIRVKYGHQPEIHAEVAATRLLAALGYAADHVYMTARLRCRGCPMNPFVTMVLLDVFGVGPPKGGPYGRRGRLQPAHLQRDFEWVSVDRKFAAAPIEDDAREGWAWWELKNVQAPRVELDALRLIAVFLAHWDNKADNQRLVCMDKSFAEGQACRDSVLMIQDVGATFGPTKVNLAQWRHMPIWTDRAACTVSMHAMPYRGATFADAQISEAARIRVGTRLASFSDADLRKWFADARFPQFYESTDDEKDIEAWIEAYRNRVAQILTAGPCPA
jgi:hypothetical protein